MGVQFILGRSGTGKTAACLRAIADSLASDAAGAEALVLLVPEQATWQAERAILSDGRIAGYSRLRVVSFNRLMFHLSGPGAGIAGSEISRAGRQMAVHKVLRECAGRLAALGPSANAQGLAAELTRTIIELQEYEQHPEELERLADELRRLQPRHPSAGKFADIALVYRGYLDFLKERAGVFVNPDARLTAVRQNVAAAGWLKGMRLWVDGFSSFTVQQRELLVELLKAAGESAIAFCLDPEAFDWRNPDRDAIDAADLFNTTRRTYADLFEAVRRCKLPLRDALILKKPLRFGEAPALAHIERNIFGGGTDAKAAAGDAVRLAAAPSIRAEADWIAREIQRLVRREDLRFRDIAVVVSDIGSYQPYIEGAFGEYGIPFFVDRPRPFADHPLVELIRSGLQAVLGGFAAADVFGFLKTGLAGVGGDEIDLLENYCLAWGVGGEDWAAEEAWDFAPANDRQFDAGEIDRIRRAAAAPLMRLKSALASGPDGGGISAEQFTRAVWECLEGLGVRDQIAAWCVNDPDDGQGHRQLYEKLVGLFDELCAVFADDRMGAADFAAVFGEAVGGLTLKLIPSRLDQVLVGAIERSRHPDLCAVFLAGATQKAFPSPVSFDAILTEEERQIAESREVELGDPLGRQLASRQYLAYIAFTRPSRRLYVTYPTMDTEGRPTPRSSFVDQLAGLFCDAAPMSCLDRGCDADEVYSRAQLKGLLCEGLGRDSRMGENGRDVLVQLYGGMCGHGDAALAEAADVVRSALSYDNVAALDASVCRRVFGRTMDSSVTRLGAFAACPFRHFARYMLDVDRRKLFRFEPVDLGAFYHRVLDSLFRSLDAAGKDMATVEEGELIELCRAEIAEVWRTDAFLANFRMRGAHNAFVLDCAAHTVEECVGALAEMSRAGSFRQKASELKFGGGEDGSHAFEFALGDGRSVRLHGSIDRVDVAECEGMRIGLVFDYKRRDQSVSWPRLYYGLDMQLAVYMLALEGAIAGGRGIDAAAGAFFVPIEAPPPSESASGIDKQTGRFRHKSKGILDGRFAGLLVTGAERGWNRYYNFGVDKDGAPYNYFNISAALRSEQFAAVLSAARAKIVELAGRILSGDIAIRPYRMAKVSPCGHCDYAALCRFDWQINDYNSLEPLDKTAVLERLGGTA